MPRHNNKMNKNWIKYNQYLCYDLNLEAPFTNQGKEIFSR